MQATCEVREMVMDAGWPLKLSRLPTAVRDLLASVEQYARTITKELGSSGPYAMLFCLDDLDKKKHRDIINSLKIPFLKT